MRRSMGLDSLEIVVLALLFAEPGRTQGRDHQSGYKNRRSEKLPVKPLTTQAEHAEHPSANKDRQRQQVSKKHSARNRPLWRYWYLGIPRSVEASPMRRCHARDTTKVRSGVPGGSGPDRARDRQPIAKVAQDLGIHAGTLANWVNKDRALRDERDGLSLDERDELARLRRRVNELEMERDVLKRSVVLWVREATSR